jgi:hypothetical protein
MSADWYFVKTGFFGWDKTIGPIDENELRTQIKKGSVNPETMVSSTSKTHGAWKKMKEIRVAIKYWEETHPSKKGPKGPH